MNYHALATNLHCIELSVDGFSSKSLLDGLPQELYPTEKVNFYVNLPKENHQLVK
jgi:hypothetical protein